MQKSCSKFKHGSIVHITNKSIEVYKIIVTPYGLYLGKIKEESK